MKASTKKSFNDKLKWRANDTAPHAKWQQEDELIIFTVSVF